MGMLRRFSLILAAILALTLPAAAADASGWLVPPVKEAPAFADAAGSWCEEEVAVLYEAGLMEGVTDTDFGVGNTLMPEHVVVVCARLYSLLTGGDGVLPAPAEGEAWYQPGYDALARALDYEGGSEALMMNFHATKYPARRWHFVQLLYETLEAAGVELPAVNAVTAVPDSTDPAVLALYRAGILTGNDEYGTFDGEGTLTRGQAAAILARLVDPALRRTFTLKSFDLCADVLGVAPDTVLLTVGGRAVTAELFACQLCTSLHQRGGGTRAALEDAVSAWCCYAAPFRPLAEQLGLSLTEEEAQAEQYGRETAGYLGLSAAYWQYQQTGVLLNAKMRTLYWEKDWKNGEAAYHNDLEAMSEALLESAELSPALEALDLAAVYGRLAASPFPLWNF